MTHLPGKFVWFEHLSSDTQQARAFYEALFGWHVERMPLGDVQYEMILNGRDGIGGLGAGTVRARWATYVSVTDVDATYAAALAAGASSDGAPMDYGPVGRGAAIVDPSGARLSFWRSAEADRPDPPSPTANDFCWAELWAPDAEKALAFYQLLLGYGTQTMDMDDQGTYFVLTAGDLPRGGLFQAPAGAPPQWLPYVQVADCDDVVARAAAAGATVLMAPQDVPEVGRIAIFVDPQGATLGVIKSLARG